MKHFKLILTALRIVFTLLFTANVIFMVQLYGSIKQRYVSDVEQSLSRADQIEMVDRIVKAGLGGADDVVWVQIGMQKSDVGQAMTAEELRKTGYSQGFQRVDRQIMNFIALYLHEGYDYRVGPPDIRNMEQALRRDLGFYGYYPATVRIARPGDKAGGTSGLWKIEYRVDGKLIYIAYISPLTENILREMSGVIVTSLLIAIALTFGFWYLMRVIARQRSLEEMKDDFTSNMTHELKTPIAIAYAANDSLLQFPDPADEARTRKYLTASLEQLSILSSLVESILSMSMERRKRLTMNRERIELRPFLARIIDRQKLRAGKPCEITLDCSDGATVEADSSHLSNVVGNLIDNSIKYSGESVRIAVKADAGSLSVSDDGIGIPEKALPHIFEKFYRVPHGNCAAVRGYGIGLFYVKSIVDKHGWTIHADSRSGKGSTFTIKFKQS